jgi:cell division protein FtsI (penicillin-binding protein 3)
MARRVPHVANPLLKVKIPAWRSRALMGVMAAGFLVLGGRAVWLQVMTNDYLKRQGESRFARNLELPATRGKILDRNGIVLASSLPAKAIWAIPEDVNATRAQLLELSKLLGMPEAELDKKLKQEDRDFVYVKRQVDIDQAQKIAALKIAGIYQRNEYKRYYPEGDSTAHIVGFTNIEDIGQEGIELSQQKMLAGKSGSRRVIKDRLGRVIEDIEAIQPPYDGKEVNLSIDTKIQFLAFNALRDTVREHKAKAGAVVVLDVVTGEVLAMANWPTYNPNNRIGMQGAQLRNRTMTDTFEPGSTMKPFTAALALESGQVKPHTTINTAPGKLTIGSATIGDSHAYGVLTVEQIIQKSSNVGTAKMALEMSSQKMWEMYTALGFGQAPNLGFPGAVAGRVRPFKTWKPIEKATMSYGYGLSVSLMQLARSYSVFAREGDMIAPVFFKQEGHATGVQVFRPETAKSVRKMLELAAGSEGTAPLSRVEGYRVAGKTGTARKRVETGYTASKYVASFVGFAPVSAPRIVVAVMIDEPGAGKYYGGEVAAPMFSRIVGDTLRAMRVAPDAPFALKIAPTQAVKESI